MKISIDSLDILPQYEKLFKLVFEHNPDLNRINFRKKIIGNEKYRPSIITAKNESGNLLAVLCIFPAIFTDKTSILRGGQIGDALVIPSQRGKGLFKKLISFAEQSAKTLNYDFLYTFPSLNNPGSLKSFTSREWIEVHKLTQISFQTSSGIIGRLLRRLNEKLYSLYEILVTPTTETIPDPVWRKIGTYNKLDPSYIEYKKFSQNRSIELNSAICYISLSKFSIKISHFEYKKNKNFSNLLFDLRKLAQKLAKDTVEIVFSPQFEHTFIDIKGEGIKNSNLSALVSPTKNINLIRSIGFIGIDIDTF